MKHYTRFLVSVPQNAIREIAEPIERKHREIDGFLKMIQRIENELEELENNAFDQFRKGGWTTEEISEAKSKAFTHKD